MHAPTPDLARLNRQGLMHLQRLAGNASVSALISSDVPVQRFLAIGPTTHETIEEPGLAAAGLTQQQIEMVDLGNWMRDLSQLQMAPIGTTGGNAAFEVISILARGLFDKDITPAELGGYLPAEHLDRPEQKVKDPKEPVPPSPTSPVSRLTSRPERSMPGGGWGMPSMADRRAACSHLATRCTRCRTTTRIPTSSR
ncbi:MAG: hypothetical protein E6I60_16280 [Chloroflexi bacterium]|nr:MAG: hypothetical protein E6I60_16280 [Chloroflexota bacterium]